MYTMFLLGSALVSASPVAAGTDSELDRCLASAQGIAPVHLCYQDALNRVDRAIDQRTAELPGRLDGRRSLPGMMSVGEAAWRTYRDKWCAFEEAAERDPDAKAATGLQCRVEIGEDHLARLKHPF